MGRARICGNATKRSRVAAGILSLLRTRSFFKTMRRHPPILLVVSTALMFCLGAAWALTGCPGMRPSLPPNNYIINPAIAFDPQGNLIVAYQVNVGRGPITYLQKLTPDGERLWGKQGIRLDKRQPEPSRHGSWAKVVTDEQGNATVLWDYKDQILAKKVDGNGQPVWKKPVVLGTGDWYWTVLPNTAGATVAWTEEYNLRVQTIDGNGNIVRPGQPLAAQTGDFAASCDTSGTTWIVWKEGYTEAIRLQRLDQTGKATWPQAKELQQGLAQPSRGISAGMCSFGVTPDGSGGVVVSWLNHDSSLMTLCRVDRDGNVLWRATDESNALGDDLSSYVASDGRGGVFLVSRDTSAPQHIDSQGRLGWSDSGASGPIDTSGEGIDFSEASDGAGGFFVTWDIAETHPVVHYAQRIDSSGNKLWTANGVAIASVRDSAEWSVVPSGSAVFISGGTPYGGETNGESRIQKLDADGRLLWGANGIRLDDWRATGSASN